MQFNSSYSLRLASVSALAGKCLPSNTKIGFILCDSSNCTYLTQYMMCLKRKQKWELAFFFTFLSIVHMILKLHTHTLVSSPRANLSPTPNAPLCNLKPIQFSQFKLFRSFFKCLSVIISLPAVWIDGHRFIFQWSDVDVLACLLEER